MNSRSEAQAAIDAGKVLVNGQPALKASVKVGPSDLIESEKAHPYVSRAALKLKGALDVLPVSPEGFVCLDIGCSTGGFTEILLEQGASHVISVDVGRDQFHDRLRANDRITLYEQMDARKLTASELSDPIDMIVTDASFIGLEKVLIPALSFVRPGGNLIALFKPQFQVGPKSVGKGGIVTDVDAVELTKDSFSVWLTGQGWGIRDWQPSLITGSDGNQEWLVWAMKDPG